MIMAVRSYALVLLVVFSTWGPSASHGNQREKPGVLVQVLVDLSQSWTHEARRAQNLDVFNAVTAAIRFTGAGAHSTTVTFRAIGNNPFRRPPLCDIPKFRRSFVVKEGILTTSDQFSGALAACVAKLNTLPSERTTDIMGAVRTVAELRDSRLYSHVLVIMLSDFVEETKNKNILSPTELVGLRFLLVGRTLEQEKHDSELAKQRLGRFGSMLRKYGAADVKSISDAVGRDLAARLSADLSEFVRTRS